MTSAREPDRLPHGTLANVKHQSASSRNRRGGVKRGRGVAARRVGAIGGLARANKRRLAAVGGVGILFGG